MEFHWIDIYPLGKYEGRRSRLAQCVRIQQIRSDMQPDPLPVQQHLGL